MTPLTPAYAQKELFAKSFMYTTTILGGLLYMIQLFQLPQLETAFVILLLFALLIGITEYFPIPVWNGFTTINFPIVYVLYLVYGIEYAIVTYGVVILVVHALQKRPFRTVLFNPAQLILSFYAGYLVATFLSTYILSSLTTPVLEGIVIFTTFLIIHVLINNAIFDVVLLLRPQAYTFTAWKTKLKTELNSALFSLIYGILLYVISAEDRGHIDIFSYFFFFSPLVGLSIIGSSFMRIKSGRNRLKRLFHLTRDLNKFILKEEGLSAFMIKFKEHMVFDQSLLIFKEDEEWRVAHHDHPIQDLGLEEKEINKVNWEEQIFYKSRKDQNGGPLQRLFSEDMESFIYTPIKMNQNTIGLIIVAKARTNSFMETEINILATVSNQLAAVLVTRKLIQEQEEHRLLEERNRIARNIHDGIAQNLAAAVMQLETMGRKTNDQRIKPLLDSSIENMRHSLFEVRNSIYTLSPPKEETVGLIPAMNKRIETFMRQSQHYVSFKIEGKPYDLSSLVEQVIYNTFQESVQNSIKHSGSEQTHVRLAYKQDETVLCVKDDGQGFSLLQAMIKAEQDSHFGISHMNEAAEKINGTLDIESAEGKGTEITLTVPRIEMEASEHD